VNPGNRSVSPKSISSTIIHEFDHSIVSEVLERLPYFGTDVPVLRVCLNQGLLEAIEVRQCEGLADRPVISDHAQYVGFPGHQSGMRVGSISLSERVNFGRRSRLLGTRRHRVDTPRSRFGTFRSTRGSLEPGLTSILGCNTCCSNVRAFRTKT